MSLEALQSFFGEEKGNIKKADDKPLTEAQSPTLTAGMVREQESRKKYHEMSENIRKSERLRAKLTYDIKNNISSDDLLLTALECISLMTGDTVFLKQNKKTLEDRA